MRMFDPVVIACDQATLDVAMAVRSALELFRLRVHLHLCVQRRNVLDLLAGRIPDSEYVVLCWGGQHAPHGPEIRPSVVDQVDGKWQQAEVALSSASVPQLVHLPGRTVLALGCSTGAEPIAQAFLRSGCRAYVGPTAAVDQDATALFAISFFYHLLSPDRDSDLACTEEEAVRRARAIDRECRAGTHVFRYYGSERSGCA